MLASHRPRKHRTALSAGLIAHRHDAGELRATGKHLGHALGSRPGNIDAHFLHGFDHQRIEHARLEAGAVGLVAALAHLIHECLRHLTAGAIVNTDEQDLFGPRLRLAAAARAAATDRRKRNGLAGVAIKPPAKRQGHVHQADEDGHLDQRPDHRREGGARVDAKHGDGDGDRQFEVVARGGESDRRRLRVVGADAFAHPEAHEKHHQEEDQQRHRDPQHVGGDLHDQAALEAEHHEDREEQRDERDRADGGDEGPLIPVASLEGQEPRAGGHAQREGNAEIDGNRLGDPADANLHRRRREAEERRKNGEQQPGIDAVEENLQHAVQGDQGRRILGITLCQFVPDDHHRDAGGDADHDQPRHVVGLVVKEDGRECKHQERADEPALK